MLRGAFLIPLNLEKVVPWGARHLVRWIRDTYGDEKGIIVTENGYTDSGNVMDDLDTRGRYHKV